ncbi:MAG: D-alanine--D-alanine ligase [Actinobacteria bacterium]|nr:D-alanine--D-alanine ligase [Actinomycetota bacterium]
MSKIVVAILCGGRSSEHEISCISAGGILGAIDRDIYEPVLIGITRTAGRWVLIPESYSMGIVDGVLPTVPEDAQEISTDLHGFSVNGKALHVDVIFPMLHGPYGEDGTIQGFTKSIFEAHGMKVAQGILITAEQWATERDGCEKRLSMLTYPIFVKPARGGSSRGTSKVHSRDEFDEAIEEAHRYDRKTLVEETVSGREIECAVLEMDGVVRTSQPGEVIIDGRFEFYDFEAKYLDDATDAKIPANIPQDATLEIRRLASLAFTSLGCSGLARVDFFYRENGQVVINEINTIPGFTPTSMFPNLWAQSGISYAQLIHELIKTALTRVNSVLGN